MPATPPYNVTTLPSKTYTALNNEATCMFDLLMLTAQKLSYVTPVFNVFKRHCSVRHVHRHSLLCSCTYCI